MKIAVSADGKELDSFLDQSFGRCPYFVVVETEDMSFDSIDNRKAALCDGAGVQSVDLVISKGVSVVITGNCSSKSVQKLSEVSVEIIIGVMGTVRQVVEMYKKGVLLSKDKANVGECFVRQFQDPSRLITAVM